MSLVYYFLGHSVQLFLCHCPQILAKGPLIAIQLNSTRVELSCVNGP